MGVQVVRVEEGGGVVGGEFGGAVGGWLVYGMNEGGL